MSDLAGALVFKDGSVWSAQGIGAPSERVGELVFNTSMTGFQEAITDPSYAGQILTFSYPLIGNYGCCNKAVESEKAWVQGVVVFEACQKPVHVFSEKNLDDFLADQGIPGLQGIDVRALVKKIRLQGVVPAGIVVTDQESLPKAVAQLSARLNAFDYSKINYVQTVSPSGVQTIAPDFSERTVVLVDCGAKKGIVQNLLQRNCTVHIAPFNYTANEILKLAPDGVMFSNGPGDPAQLSGTVAACQGLLGKVPIFGICLGHQILAQALGAKTFKLKFGHRGINHAVKDLTTGKIAITSQNHGYAVHKLPKTAQNWMVNCLDGTNEGLLCEKHNAFSVQFHPEANPGPYDANHLFDLFLEKMQR